MRTVWHQLVILALGFAVALFILSPDENGLLKDTSLQTESISEKGKTKQVLSKSDEKNCIETRGTGGCWERNSSFSHDTFHALGFRSDKWKRMNQQNLKNAVHPGNEWIWKETSTASTENQELSDCQTRPVNKILFCGAMQKLGIGRMLLVGDSLMGGQMDSLLLLLGHDIGQFVKTRKGDASAKRDTLDCNTSMKIQFAQENLGPNHGMTNIMGRDDAALKHRQQFGPETPDCAGLQTLEKINGLEHCPWHLLCDASSVKTLLLLNQGAHFHSPDTFSKSFGLCNSIAHAGDLADFCSAVPGHGNCFNAALMTTEPGDVTHNKFLQRQGTGMHDWNLFDCCNPHAKEKLKDIVPEVSTHHLNVCNMSVLRPDQHAAGNDCLHCLDASWPD